MRQPPRLADLVVKAPPLWSISAEANERERDRRRHLEEQRRAAAALVTKHPAAWLGEPITAAARSLERVAQSKGMTTLLVSGLDWCRLEGRIDDERRGFRAYWRRGKADHATWYEPTEEWVTVPDTRPVGLSKTTRTTLAGHRHPGVDTRSYPVRSPHGVTVSFAELTTRVKALS